MDVFSTYYEYISNITSPLMVIFNKFIFLWIVQITELYKIKMSFKSVNVQWMWLVLKELFVEFI